MRKKHVVLVGFEHTSSQLARMVASIDYSTEH